MTTQIAPQPAKKAHSHWLLWWKIDAAELQQQVADYAKGYGRPRHISAYLLGFSIAITVAFVQAGLMDSSAYLDMAVMAVLAVLIFLGQGWAMVAAMLFWTFEKGMGIVDLANPAHGGGGMVVPQVIWWATYMHAFWLAFRVEQERGKVPPAPSGRQGRAVVDCSAVFGRPTAESRARRAQHASAKAEGHAKAGAAVKEGRARSATDAEAPVPAPASTQ
jgi:hypothetical protein